MSLGLRKQIVGGVVALAYLLVALSDGGFQPAGGAVLAGLAWISVVVLLVISSRDPGIGGDAGLSIIGATGLAGLAALSLGWSPDPGQGFEVMVRYAAYAGLLILAVIAYRRLGAGPLLGGLGLAIGLLAVVALSTRVLIELPGDRDLVDAFPSAAGLLSFPIGYWNGLAACMALGIVLFAWHASHADDARARALAVGAIPLAGLVIYLASSRGGLLATLVGVAVVLGFERRKGRMLAALAIAAGVSGLLIAYTGTLDQVVAGSDGPEAQRQGILMFGAVLLAFAAAVAAFARIDPLVAGLEMPTLRSRALARLAATAAVLAVVVVGPGDLSRGFQDPLVATEPGSGIELASGTGRYQYWRAGLDAFASEPGLGIGVGGYQSWWDGNGALARSVRFAHNLPLGVAAELGLAGLIALGLMFAPPLSSAFTRLRGGRGKPGPDDPTAAVALALLATGLVSSMLEWSWEIPAATIPVLVAIGLLVGRPAPKAVAADLSTRLQVGCRWLGLSRSEPAIGVAWIGRVLTPVLAFVGVGVVASALLLYSTDVRLDRADRALAAGDLAGAAREARAAALLEPWSTAPRGLLAQVEIAAGNPDGAAAELGLAIERAPASWQPWLELARVRAATGERGSAIVALARALELSPRNPLLTEPNVILDALDR